MRNDFVVIPIFPYQEINSEGVIRTIKTGKLRKTRINNTGYWDIQLKDIDGNMKVPLVHRLVALAHLPEFTVDMYYDNENYFIDHIDGSRTNCDITNLRVVTKSENYKAYLSIEKNNPAQAKRNKRNGVWFTKNTCGDLTFYTSWYEAKEKNPNNYIYFQKYGSGTIPEIVD